MAIQINCQCGRTCNFSDQQAGQSARCMYCGQVVNVPRIAGTPAAADELTLESPKPSLHGSPAGDAPVAPVRAISPKPAAPAHASVPGLGIGQFIFWGVTAAVLGVVVFAIYSLVHWWNMSEYEGYLAGGEDWMAKNYLTDAENNFNKAKKLFPNDPRTESAFFRLEQAKENKKRLGTQPNAILGPIAAPGIMSADVQQRLMQAQMLQQQAQMKQREIEQRVREAQEDVPPVMTPAMLEARKKQQEEFLQAQEARRKEAEAARAAAEQQRAEREQQAEAERQQKLEQAKKDAEERKKKDDAARKARQDELQARRDQVDLGQLTAWSTDALRQSLAAGKSNEWWANTYNFEGLSIAIQRAVAAEDAANETVPSNSSAVLRKIGDIGDVQGLKEFSKSLPKLISQAEEAEESGRKAKVVWRNQMTMTVRGNEQLVAQEAQLKGQYTAEATRKREAIRGEREKLIQKLQPMCASYQEGLNNCRGAKAAKELLQEASKLTTARLKELGVEPAPVVAAPAPSSKVKTYVMKDGTEIKALTVVAAGDDLVIKDESGGMHTVSKAEVKEIRP